MKRFLSVFVALLIVLSVLPVCAFADDSTTTVDNSKYIYKLTTLQPDGTNNWYYDSDTRGTFTFHSTAPMSLCYDVYIDGQKVAWDDYSSYADGSGITYVLNQDVLENLSHGDHRLSVYYTNDKRGAMILHVMSVTDPPITGDSSLALWAAVLCMSAAATYSAVTVLRKKHI